MTAAPQVTALGGRTLAGRFVALEPLAEHHHAGLIAAAADPAIWTYMPRDMRGGLQPMLDWHSEQAALGQQKTYAVRRLADQALIGATSFLAIAPKDGRVEIGATWYRRDAWGSAVNPQAKYLLLDHAFGAGYGRVEFKTDSRNLRSRAALLKLGAVEEGTLRSHAWVPPGEDRDGYRRDTVYYAILAAEWSGVRTRLEQRLEQYCP